ncbi:MAG: O-antigen ligase family protein [Dysgonamonadaceae bacterium]|jgi:O-antigen ligase|nr:O-antigen ligase family protein [Dysgonamonadaceae bacterium]
MEQDIQSGEMRNRTRMTFSSACVLLPFLLVLATVFVVSKDLANGVVSGKYFWFYASMGLVGLTAPAGTVFNRKGGRETPRFSAMDTLVLCFVASVYVSALVLNDASQNTTKLTILGLLVVLYFSFRLIHSSFRRLRVKHAMTNLICPVIILTGLVEAVWGLLQLYGFEQSQHGIFKLTGSFFNPGPYSGYLAVVFPLAYPQSPEGGFGLSYGKAPFRGWGVGLSVLTCIAILLVLPAAMSRAAWLAAIAGSAVAIYPKYAAKFFNLTKPKAPFRGLGVGVGLRVCAVMLLLSAACTGLYFLKKDSADGRLLTWKVSLQTVSKHPFGVGLGNFSGAYGDAQAAYFASGNATETEAYVAGNPEYGFNEFLQIAIESGIISLLLFLAIIGLAIRNMFKAGAWGRLGSLVALLVFACFSYPFSVLPFLVVLVFLISAAEWNADGADDTPRHCGLDPQSQDGSGGIDRGLRVKPAMTARGKCRSCSIALLCLLLTSFCLYKQYPVYEAYKQWNKNRSYYHAGLYNEAAANYETLYPYLNDQIQFLFEYAQSLSKAVNQEMPGRGRHDLLTKSNEVLRRAQEISCDPMLSNVMGKNYQALKEYDKAEAALVKSTQLVPNRLYPWYLLMKLYAETGQTDKAREAAAIVQTKEPKVQSQAVREMRREAEKMKGKN